MSKKDEILQAIQASNLDALKALITADNVNTKDRSGYTLLHVATNSDKTQVAKWLVAQGADLNIHCNTHTVLSLAVNKANYELFHFYLEKEADCIGRSQLNILHEAANKSQYDIVEKLIDRGADPNQFNNMQITPLTISVQHKNKRIILLLLESGACANLPDKKGATAIHLACSMGDPDIVHCLLDNTECDLKLKNGQDETPLDLFWMHCIKEAKQPDSQLIYKLIEFGGLFSMPWNYTFSSLNHVVFVKAVACLCKWRLRELFLPDRPLFTELVINGYWSNSLIVAIKSAIIEFKKDSSVSERQTLTKAIETILLSGELKISEADLCSTFYMFDEADEYELYKFLKAMYARPFTLKSLTRRTVRRCVDQLNVETVDKLDMLDEELKNFLIFESLKNSKF